MTQPVGIFRARTPEVIGVDVDLRLSEIHAQEANVTDQPIEDGSLVSDHIVLQPETVEITAEVSNFDGNNSVSLGERAKTAFQAFKTRLQSRELFDLVTHHELYENMALQSISADHSAPYQGRLLYRLSFKRVNTTQLSIVRVPESQLLATGDNPVAKTASSEVNRGRQDADEDSQVLQSSLASFLGEG